MITQTESRLTSFAIRYDVSPSDAVALPSTFEIAARKVGMARNDLIGRAMANRELGEYLAGIARQAAKEL